MDELLLKVDKYLEQNDFDAFKRKRCYELLIDRCNEQIDNELFEESKEDIDELETDEIDTISVDDEDFSDEDIIDEDETNDSDLTDFEDDEGTGAEDPEVTSDSETADNTEVQDIDSEADEILQKKLQSRKPVAKRKPLKTE